MGVRTTFPFAVRYAMVPARWNLARTSGARVCRTASGTGRDHMMRHALRTICAALVVLTAMTVFVSCGSGSPPSPVGEGDRAAGDEPVARASQALTKGTAGALNGDADYCDNAANKCNFGEGDCDTDAQCATGLVCGHAQGRRFLLAADVD